MATLSKLLALLAGLLILATSSPAATLLRYSETRTLEAQDRSDESVSEIEIWLDSDRARYVGYPETLLLDATAGRLVIVDPVERFYSIVDHPFRLEDQAETEAERRAMRSVQALIDPLIELEDSGEAARIGPWMARKYLILVRDRDLEIEITVWMSKDPPVDPDHYRRLMRDHYALGPVSRLWAETILSLEGIPVLQKEVSLHTGGGARIGTRSRTRTLQLLAVESRRPSTDTFEVPPDHESRPFDLSRYIHVVE